MLKPLYTLFHTDDVKLLSWLVGTLLMALVLAVSIVPDEDRRRVRRVKTKSELRRELILTPEYEIDY